jgi:cytochrome P450
MQRAVAAAAERAAERGCDEVAIEHLLLTIALDSQSAACFIFEDSGVSRLELIERIERVAPRGSAQLQRANRLAAATMHLLDVAVGEADRLNHAHVGTEHVALALSLLNNNAGSQILAEFGLTHQKADAAQRKWFAQGMPRQRGRGSRLPRWLRPAWRWVRGPGLIWKVYVRKSLGHPRFVTDPYPMYRWLREREPLRKDPIAPVWVLTRHADVAAMLKDPRLRKDPFAVERLPPTMREQLGVTRNQMRQADVTTVSMLFLDPPQHTRIRGWFSKAFTPRMIEALRPRIQQITDKRLEKVRAAGTMDVIETIAYPLPVVVIAELLGFPPEDFPSYKKWSDDFAAALGLNPSLEQQAAAERSREELRAYFTQLVAKLEKRPDERLLSALLAMEREPAAMSREELFINAILLLAAGHETTTNLIGNGMLALLRHPDQLKLLRDEPGLIESAVEELLRYDSPVQWASRVTADRIEIGGKTLEAGEILLGSLGAANRDPAAFAEPDRLDIRRPENRHLSFGSGIHFCLGAALARMEAQIAIGTMVSTLNHLELAQSKVRWKKGLTFRAMEELWVRFSP